MRQRENTSPFPLRRGLGIRGQGGERERESVKTQTSNSQSGIPRDTKKGTLTVAKTEGGYAYVDTGNRGIQEYQKKADESSWTGRANRGWANDVVIRHLEIQLIVVAVIVIARKGGEHRDSRKRIGEGRRMEDEVERSIPPSDFIQAYHRNNICRID